MKKSMVKVAAMAAMMMVSVAASAQFSVNAGYVSTKSSQSNSDALPGITAGVGYDMEVQGGIGLSWGLNYTYAWKNTEIAGVKEKSTDHVLDVPVRLTYTKSVSDALKVFGFAGPKFVYAVSGKTNYPIVGDLKHYGDAYGQQTPFDIKLGLGAGVNFNSILLKVGYDWGLLNQWGNKTQAEASTLTSNQFYVTVGFAL